ncbi:melanoma antigen recognized by T-cells 1 [Pantherophis guttatus]|uniref:Melanoma antigen recognized by T-cells 1 n=1 Tax=Pantherophis guttatus TaxID=94885 RepID=A0A6P9B7B4_PANGU|nr:melanoma antigen recognized by T-cells 1 [Pantherophis guttatus]
MPRGEHYLDGNFGRGKGYTSLSPEEATGIGILIVLLAVLLILGCWCCKRHSGYKRLLSKNFGLASLTTSEGRSSLSDSKLPLREYTSSYSHVVPDAPPAYDKSSSSLLPPPYAP